MLVILSDLHLSDGTASYNINPQAFDILQGEIERSVIKNEAQELRLVLLGDIFDLVRTDWWFDPANVTKKERPWYNIDPRTGLNENPTQVEKQFRAVLQRILDDPTTKGFISMIKALPEVRGQKPKITYVIGNHDRALNNFPSLQSIIRDEFPDLSFDFTSAFCDMAYGVAARHGHEWDENCNARLLLKKVLRPNENWNPLDSQINQVMAIGEVITAELMSGLVHAVHTRGADSPNLAEMIKGVDNLRPSTDVFQWLQWQTRGAKLKKKEEKLLVQSLIDAISGVVDSDLGKLWDRIQTDLLVSGDVVDRLQLVRGRLKACGLDGLREFAKLFVTIGNFADALFPGEDAFYRGAKDEFAFFGQDIQFVVYGHTHKARHDYLSASPDGKVQLYINTGTYLPLVQRTDDQSGFATSHQMTLAFFFRDDEDVSGKKSPGPTLDLWNGIKRKEYA